MKKIAKLFVFLAILAIAQSCVNNNNNNNNNNDIKELSGNISVSGAFALYPMTVKWAEEFQKLHPEVRIDISAGGAGKGMTDALNGIVDIGMFSRQVSQEEINKGCWFIAVAKDAVLPTINSNNPFINELKQKGLMRQHFIDIFITEKTKKWSQCLGGNSGNKINVYTRSDACGAAEIWGKYLGGKQESIKGIGVYGDPGMASAVKNDVDGIGFNNVAYVYDNNTRKKNPGVDVIPIDINENGKIDADEMIYGSLDEITKAIKADKYPSPPARDLYFVSKGKPKNELVTEFLKWILTDGQKYVSEAGYVTLSDEKIKSETNKLN
jgi:phosphate transport system substrate-binding protein